jgi:high affinity Mn2+ porin
MRFAAIPVLLSVFLASTVVQAQSDEQATVLDHPTDQRFYVGGQMNFIFQGHGTFRALYTAPQSFKPDPEHALSDVLTLYTGLRLGRGWEVFFDIESAGGRGLSDAFGLAGFTNLDVVRNPSLGTAPYLARLMIRKIVALSSEQTDVDSTPLGLAPRLPSRRLEIRAGKFGMVDFFDVNAVGSDSHRQFTNWTIANNGAYDYAADTRGYTYGVIVEYDTPRWSVRGAEALMPTVANGIVLDWDVARSRGENVELEWRPNDGLTMRFLGYANHANMGSYSAAIDAFESGTDTVPDIQAHRQQGRLKRGMGANAEYRSSSGLRFFGRTGWNDGDSESYAYTEVNNTLASIGGPLRHRVRFQWPFRPASNLPAARRPGFPPRRWRADVRPRGYCRDLLHSAPVARCVRVRRCSVHRASGLQPSARSRVGAGRAPARGFLT